LRGSDEVVTIAKQPENMKLEQMSHSKRSQGDQQVASMTDSPVTGAGKGSPAGAGCQADEQELDRLAERQEKLDELKIQQI
jgi:hypothetical protein